MVVTANRGEDGSSVHIQINGRFDFNANREFRQAFELASGEGAQYVIDLGEAEYMDSSALGMLLMLREHAGGQESCVRITNANSEIRNILNISNFNKLFQID